MLAYISLGIGLCNIVAVCVFFLAWFELHDHLKNSTALQADFQAAVRRLMISVGFFGMPLLSIYLQAISVLLRYQSLIFLPGLPAAP
jgi:hypothetical protein